MNDGDGAATSTGWGRRLETGSLKLSARGEQGPEAGNAKDSRVPSAAASCFSHHATGRMTAGIGHQRSMCKVDNGIIMEVQLQRVVRSAMQYAQLIFLFTNSLFSATDSEPYISSASDALIWMPVPGLAYLGWICCLFEDATAESVPTPRGFIRQCIRRHSSQANIAFRQAQYSSVTKLRRPFAADVTIIVPEYDGFLIIPGSVSPGSSI